MLIYKDKVFLTGDYTEKCTKHLNKEKKIKVTNIYCHR